jgi:hypothetical protein
VCECSQRAPSHYHERRAALRQDAAKRNHTSSELGHERNDFGGERKEVKGA